MNQTNLYAQTAHFYDFELNEGVYPDVPFYLTYLKDVIGPVLELACGTGRVAIPLAEAGRTVWGVDLSETMLAIFAAKRAQLNVAVAKRLHLVQASMTDFKLDETFGMVVIPFRAFNVLTTTVERRACLTTVYEHVRPDGLFIIDMHRYESAVSIPANEEIERWQRTNPNNGDVIRKTICIQNVDPNQRIVEPVFTFYVTHADERTTIYRDNFRVAFPTLNEMRVLLRETGWHIVKELGDVDGRSISEGSELIFVCRKT